MAYQMTETGQQVWNPYDAAGNYLGPESAGLESQAEPYFDPSLKPEMDWVKSHPEAKALGNVDIGGISTLYQTPDGSYWYRGKKANYTPETAQQALSNTEYERNRKIAENDAWSAKTTGQMTAVGGLMLGGALAASGVLSGLFTQGGPLSGFVSPTASAADLELLGVGLPTEVAGGGAAAGAGGAATIAPLIESGSELVGNAIGAGEITTPAALETAGLGGAQAAGAGTVGAGITAADVASGASAANTAANATGATTPAGTTAGTTAGTVASTAGGLSSLASAAKDAGLIAGGITAGNALLGDPLGLNKGADEANAAATRASQASADAQTQLAQIAQDQWNYYKTNYQPLETNLIKQATEAGSPEEFSRAREAASGDVTGAYDQARKQAASRLQSFGINPGSPAYQAALASTDLAEGASKAGALTMADRNTRNLAYSKGLDVAGLGRNIPAQSSASTANAANAANAAANVANNRQIVQNAQGVANTKALGSGIEAFGGLASKWFGSPTTTPTTPNTNDFSYDSGLRFAHGGLVAKHPTITPHMNRFADGGGVGRQGMAMPDMSNMGLDASETNEQLEGPGTETSDSIPAQVDGEEPAELSSGEFVVNASAVDLTGEEILTAINNAGLEKRGQTPPPAATGYSRGGRVMRYGLGRY